MSDRWESGKAWESLDIDVKAKDSELAGILHGPGLKSFETCPGLKSIP